jgi:uncharacterized membrane protein
MMDFDLLLGRIHPLIIHLPIGVFFGAYFLDIFYRVFSKENDVYYKILSGVYIFSFLTALFACISGYILSKELKFDPEIQNIHQWMAVCTTLVLGINAYYFISRKDNSGVKQLFIPTTIMILLTMTGHFGGILTHGKDHLSKYAPSSMQWVLGKSDQKIIDPPDNPDSVLVYDDFVRPMLKNNCVQCHNNDVHYGGFIAENYHGLFVSNKGTIPIAKGNSKNSELFSRVSLERREEKFMPPNGDGLSFYEMKILKYWIDQGADSLAVFEKDKMDVDLVAHLYEKYNLDFSDLPFYEKNIPDSLGQDALTKLLSNGIQAKYLGEENYFLEVTISTDSITSSQIKYLAEVKNHVTFLNLSSTKLNDELLEVVEGLPNITKLDLHDNPITNDGIQFISGLENLISINLYNSKVDKAGFEILLDKPSIQKIYVWGSQISPEEIEELRSKYSSKEIIGGFAFDKSQLPLEKEDAEKNK